MVPTIKEQMAIIEQFTKETRPMEKTACNNLFFLTYFLSFFKKIRNNEVWIEKETPLH